MIYYPQEHRALWMHSVPQEILDMTPAQERKRQECIYELIHTEQDFVRDLQYVHNVSLLDLSSVQLSLMSHFLLVLGQAIDYRRYHS